MPARVVDMLTPDYSDPKRGTTFECGLSGWCNGTFAVPNGRIRGSKVRRHKRLPARPPPPARRPSPGAMPGRCGFARRRTRTGRFSPLAAETILVARGRVVVGDDGRHVEEE